jgi:hypothetical protein
VKPHGYRSFGTPFNANKCWRKKIHFDLGTSFGGGHFAANVLILGVILCGVITL